MIVFSVTAGIRRPPRRCVRRCISEVTYKGLLCSTQSCVRPSGNPGRCGGQSYLGMARCLPGSDLSWSHLKLTLIKGHLNPPSSRHSLIFNQCSMREASCPETNEIMLQEAQKPAMSRGGSVAEESDSSSPSAISTPWSVLSKHVGSSSSRGVSPDAAGHSPTEPIAIIGMSCRLPGTATDIPALWDMLVSGRTAWTPGPGKRFNMKAFQDVTGTKASTVRA